MKYGRSLILCGLLALPLVAQNAGAQNSQLPSAPSRSLEERRRAAEAPPPPPPPAAEEPAPVPPTVPSTDSNGPVSEAPGDSAASATSATPATEPPAPTGGQQASAPSSNDNEPLETIRTTVDEVVVAFTVTDKNGKYVKNLTREDFLILDDKKPADTIRDFRSETGLPLRVGLLVDASNSIRDRFRFEQDAAVEFLNQIVRPRSDRAFVLGFDSNYDVIQDFTDSTEMLAKGVFKLRPGGGTALYDALYYSCRDKLMKSGEGNAARRVIILLADGEDNQSRVTRDEVIDIAQRAEVVIYAISTNVAGMRGKEDRELTRLAESTGGRAFFPQKLEDVSNAFYELESELRSQYAVAYRPADLTRDGRFRTIDIRAVGGGKDLRVRARRGYFAPKD
ncbi:MAG: VWA domain-containing protein [Candidatus Korobacteraceae bacterium]